MLPLGVLGIAMVPNGNNDFLGNHLIPFLYHFVFCHLSSPPFLMPIALYGHKNYR
jgi:hypothetical protein